MSVIKNLPPAESGRGINCLTKSERQYKITQNIHTLKHTLWAVLPSSEGFEKIATADSPYDLYELIEWNR